MKTVVALEDTKSLRPPCLYPHTPLTQWYMFAWRPVIILCRRPAYHSAISLDYICLYIRGIHAHVSKCEFLLPSSMNWTKSRVHFYKVDPGSMNACYKCMYYMPCSFLLNPQKHMDICEYGLTPCPNKCPAILRRMSLERHLANDCVQRTFSCTHCGADVKIDQKEVGSLYSVTVGSLPVLLWQ